MLGRRRHERFVFTQPPEGALRVRRDVAVHDGSEGTVMAVGQVPGVVGDVLTLDIAREGVAASARVEVLESRPQLLAGRLQHLLRLVVRSAAKPETPA